MILGTVQFGFDYGINNIKGKPTDDTIKDILDSAYLKGIRFLDTAEAYGDSQLRIGNYHSNSSFKFNVITKFKSSVKGLPNKIEERVLENIRSLNVSNLYSYMFHSFEDFDRYFSQYRKALIRLKDIGSIKKIGVSIYTNDEFEKVLTFDDIQLVQLPYNLFDNSRLRGNLLNKAKEKGVEVHTRSTFLQGLFFKEIHTFSNKIKPLTIYMKEIQRISNKYNILLGDLAINYALRNDMINKVLIGVDDVYQLRSNFKSVKRYIPEAAFVEIDNIEVKELELLNPSNW